MNLGSGSRYKDGNISFLKDLRAGAIPLIALELRTMPFRPRLVRPRHLFAQDGKPLRDPLHALSAMALAALVTVAAPAHGSNAVPDWVKAAVAQPLPNLPPSSRAVVLLDEETYTVGADGRATKHVREVVKVLRPQGRTFGEPRIWYDNDSKITSLHIWSIDPTGHEYAVKDNEIVDGSPFGEGGQYFEDARYKFAAPPGRDPGGVVALEYEQRERPYVSEEDWQIQSSIPELSETLTLVLPPGYRFKTSWVHHQPVPPTELPGNALRWQFDHVSALDLDETPLAPDWEALAGRMTVQYSGPGTPDQLDGTWKGVGQWWVALVHDRLAPDPEIAAKAAELTRGKTDFYDKAEAIGEFVQKQIRYFVIERGIGGQQPHYAKDIFRGRYGDCKDKSTLLAAMLSTVGIHSTLVAVDSRRGFVNPDLPSVYGNHMIAAIEIPAGYTSPKLRSVVTAKTGKHFLTFDPTSEMTPFGQLENMLQGGYGLLVEGPDSQVIQFPVLSPDLNRVERTGKFTLSPEGTLTGAVAEKRFGDLAEVDRYVSRLDENKLQEYLDRSFASDFMAVSLSDVKVNHAQDLNQELTMDLNLKADHFASAMGPLLMVRPRVFGSEQMPVSRKLRKVPVDLGETKQITDSFDIELPDGYTVDELPDPVKVDFGFATYQSSTELHGHTLHYSREYRLTEVTLPADKYPELQKLASVIAADEQNRAVLKRGN